MDTVRSLTEILDLLDAELKSVMAARGGLGRIERLPLNTQVSDSSSMFLIRLPNGEPAAVLAVASEVAPYSVLIAAERAQLAREAVGSVLGECIVTPWFVSALNGISYSVTPYCRPFSSNKAWYRLQRWVISDSVLEWLRRVVETTRAPLHGDECHDSFIKPLQLLASNAEVPTHIRIRSKVAAARIESGDWLPQHVLAHNDLWAGNLLRSPPSNKYPFMVIDWGGAMVRGHAIYDLLRLVRSMSLSDSRVRKEINSHCMLLGEEVDQAHGHLLAALGHLSMNLGAWPESRFLATVAREVDFLDRCIGVPVWLR